MEREPCCKGIFKYEGFKPLAVIRMCVTKEVVCASNIAHVVQHLFWLGG